MTYADEIYELFLAEIDDEFFALLKPNIWRRQLHIYLINAMSEFKECKKELKIENYICSEIPIKKGIKEVKLDDIEDIEVELMGMETGNIYIEGEDYNIEKNEDLEENYHILKIETDIQEELHIHKFNNGNFTEELSVEEMYLLALGMVKQWIRPKRNKEENLKNVITDSAYKKLSSANMLDKVMKLSDRITEEYDMKRIEYTFNDFKGFD